MIIQTAIILITSLVNKDRHIIAKLSLNQFNQKKSINFNKRTI